MKMGAPAFLNRERAEPFFPHKIDPRTHARTHARTHTHTHGGRPQPGERYLQRLKSMSGGRKFVKGMEASLLLLRVREFGRRVLERDACERAGVFAERLACLLARLPVLAGWRRRQSGEVQAAVAAAVGRGLCTRLQARQ